jgi:hypothetical protein
MTFCQSKGGDNPVCQVFEKKILEKPNETKNQKRKQTKQNYEQNNQRKPNETKRKNVIMIIT